MVLSYQTKRPDPSGVHIYHKVKKKFVPVPMPESARLPLYASLCPTASSIQVFVFLLVSVPLPVQGRAPVPVHVPVPTHVRLPLTLVSC